jgi:L-gulonolactone oxidase
MIERKGYLLNFPVEVRFTDADDVPLSTSFGRKSAYIAVHVFKGMEHEAFFRDVEDIMRSYDSRPHWGKIHHREADELSRLYPRWNEFLQLRDQLDPNRVFSNEYTKKVFGS